jgi:hypothetical protein
VTALPAPVVVPPRPLLPGSDQAKGFAPRAGGGAGGGRPVPPRSLRPGSPFPLTLHSHRDHQRRVPIPRQRPEPVSLARFRETAVQHHQIEDPRSQQRLRRPPPLPRPHPGGRPHQPQPLHRTRRGAAEARVQRPSCVHHRHRPARGAAPHHQRPQRRRPPRRPLPRPERQSPSRHPLREHPVQRPDPCRQPAPPFPRLRHRGYDRPPEPTLQLGPQLPNFRRVGGHELLPERKEATPSTYPNRNRKQEARRKLVAPSLTQCRRKGICSAEVVQKGVWMGGGSTPVDDP